ncbi:hypothetical protein GCM10010844_35920 [Deinococcus radiotolerans]|uniref:Carboxypeptidase regulatory-like domain-containing protein n=1 Tax=Deinococcus radiotolerans TaxID=1309407 RepID=A0ABQ2FPF5_9DEIO|nr:hypothetical protein GCM10010844_35920 [Deinococcus radiotolerans]
MQVDPPATPDPAVTANVITDQIVGWSAGTQGRISVVAYPTADVADAVTLSTAAVDGQGRFTLSLPTGAQVAPYMVRFQTTPREGCTGFFTQSVASATHYGFKYYLLDNATTNTVITRGLVQNNPGFTGTTKAGDYFIQRFYASTAFTVTGTLACPTYVIKANLNLKPGWNAVVQTINSVNTDGTVRDYTLTSPQTLPAAVF